MPIDPSIAMSIQPIKLENPMNSLAQLMQIESASKQNRLADLTMQQHQQTFDETNKLNSIYAGAMDPDGTINRTKLMQGLATGGLGSKAPAVQKNFFELDDAKQKVDKGNVDLIDAKLKQSRQFLDGITTPEEYIAWHEGNHKDPVLGPELARRGVTADQARAKIAKALQQPGGFQQLLQQSSLGLEKFTEMNKPTYQKTDSGQVETLLALPGLGGAPVAVNTTRKVATPGEVLRSEDAAKSRQQAQRHFDERKTESGVAAGKAPSGYRYLPNGDLEPITGGPADQKAQASAGLKAAGVADVDSAIAVLRDAYDRLDSGGGITNTENGALSNVASSISSSGVGQVVGRALGTNNQSARNDIAMTRPALLAALMKATGMSAKQMDSNAELKLWMATATDPTLDVGSNRRALANIERKYMGAAAKPTDAGSDKPAKVTDDGEYNALPSGSMFVGPDGKTRRKP